MGKCIASHRREGQKTLSSEITHRRYSVVTVRTLSLSISLHHAWLRSPPLQVGIGAWPQVVPDLTFQLVMQKERWFSHHASIHASPGKDSGCPTDPTPTLGAVTCRRVWFFTTLACSSGPWAGKVPESGAGR